VSAPVRDALGNAAADAAEGGSIGLGGDGNAAVSGDHHEAGLGGGVGGQGSAGKGEDSASVGLSVGGGITRKPEAAQQ
jgi:hypothetical protein